MISLAESRLRLLGLAEGLSFLVLMFIAMPLKYLFHQPSAVRVVGSIHGGLFVLYVLAALLVALAQRWRLRRILLALVVSVLPFGPFLLDKRLQREADAQAQGRLRVS
jgi:integral membrane protein